MSWAVGEKTPRAKSSQRRTPPAVLSPGAWRTSGRSHREASPASAWRPSVAARWGLGWSRLSGWWTPCRRLCQNQWKLEEKNMKRMSNRFCGGRNAFGPKTEQKGPRWIGFDRTTFCDSVCALINNRIHSSHFHVNRIAPSDKNNQLCWNNANKELILNWLKRSLEFKYMT